MTTKIVSGGQTGADRGGIEAARSLGTPYGGWVPKGRKSEDGQVPAYFTELQEHASEDYSPRTWANVRDSDATVLIARQPVRGGGSGLTLRYCRQQERPVLILDADKAGDQVELNVERIQKFVLDNEVKILNVAGHRESRCRGLEVAVMQTIRALLLAELEQEKS